MDLSHESWNLIPFHSYPSNSCWIKLKTNPWMVNLLKLQTFDCRPIIPPFPKTILHFVSFLQIGHFFYHRQRRIHLLNAYSNKILILILITPLMFWYTCTVITCCQLLLPCPTSVDVGIRHCSGGFWGANDKILTREELFELGIFDNRGGAFCGG